MKKAVDERSEDDPNCNKEDDPREKRIERCEELSSRCMEFIHLAHPAQDHRCVEKSIDPGHPFAEVIAEGSQPERNGDESECKASMGGKTKGKSSGTDEWFCMVLVWPFNIG